MRGRTSEFSQEVADAICGHLIEGKSLRSFCDQEGAPAASTVCRWLASNEDFRKQYAHARELQADAIFDESLDISDAKEGDVARDRLRVDTRKWMAGKLRPKRYGEKLDVEHSGHVAIEEVRRVVVDPRNPDS